jgi:hypothetical protein
VGHVARMGEMIHITPWGRYLLEKLTVTQLVKKFNASYGLARCVAGMVSPDYRHAIALCNARKAFNTFLGLRVRHNYSTQRLPYLTKLPCSLQLVSDPYREADTLSPLLPTLTHEDPF